MAGEVVNIENALYIVATPIGNLGDMTYRSVEILNNVDMIAAEDTRHSKVLLRQFTINTPLHALYDHNEQLVSQTLLNKILAGQSVALISDAGTPLISDPGYHLVQLAHQQGIKVIPIPGACALITALSAAGLPTDRFCFEGFLSAKAVAREKQLSHLQRETRTLIFYESPHRILDTLQAMQTIFGAERRAVLARELTKQFETIKVAGLAELNDFVKNDVHQQKGEFVIVIQGLGEEPTILDEETQRIMQILLNELPVKQAAKLAAEITNKKKNVLYDWALTQVY